MTNDLTPIRNKIDAIDDAIATLLVRRMELSLRVGELKKLNKTPVLDSTREESILARIANQIPDELNGVILGIFRTIIIQSRKLQSQ